MTHDASAAATAASPTSDDEGPLVLDSTPRAVSGRVAATEVKSLLLRLAGLAWDGSRQASAAP